MSCYFFSQAVVVPDQTFQSQQERRWHRPFLVNLDQFQVFVILVSDITVVYFASPFVHVRKWCFSKTNSHEKLGRVVYGNLNLRNMSGSLAPRGSSMTGSSSLGVQPPRGSISGAWFPPNSLQASIYQVLFSSPKLESVYEALLIQLTFSFILFVGRVSCSQQPRRYACWGKSCFYW